MTPEEQRIAIAEACGWTDVLTVSGWSPQGKWGTIPDYLNDLNAMHKAENYAGCYKGFNENYIGNLQAVTPEGQWHECATAAQRAEAYLRTLNLWTG